MGDKEVLTATNYHPPQCRIHPISSDPGQWSSWSSRHRDASVLKKPPQSDQIITLTYTIGELCSVEVSPKTPTTMYLTNVTYILALAATFLQKKTNSTVKRRNSTDIFVNKLYKQAEYGDYKALNEELIRDQLETAAEKRYEASIQTEAVVIETDSKINPIDLVKALTTHRSYKKLTLTNPSATATTKRERHAIGRETHVISVQLTTQNAGIMARGEILR